MPQQLSPIPSFSFTEHKLGKKWVDGKDIYEKIIDFGNLPNSTSKNVEHNIENIDKIISITGIAMSSADTIPMPIVAIMSRWGCEMGANDTIVGITTGEDRSEYYAYITIQYTKTEEV